MPKSPKPFCFKLEKNRDVKKRQTNEFFLKNSFSKSHMKTNDWNKKIKFATCNQNFRNVAAVTKVSKQKLGLTLRS